MKKHKTLGKRNVVFRGRNKIVLYKKIDVQALSDAISRWERAKEGAE